ncbi:membrane transport protein-domain-containing protein [Ganoderma leucocontextum]|nr:membrane transport protein-domain-containing protein [Ganoderma leucocontextum]
MAERDGGTPIRPLLKTTFDSILEVFLVCIAGYILARKGILDKNTQKKLNRLNVSIFTPSLLFSKVAFFLSPAKLRELWVIPIFFVVTTIVSMIVAYFLSIVMRLKKSQRAFAIAASMFMNSNSLPIALMQSLVITVPGLKWDEDDNGDAMVGRALTYLVLYSTLGMVVRWSYGVRLLSQADPEAVEDGVEASPLISPEETAFPPSPTEERMHHHGHSTPSASSDDSQTVDHGPTNPVLSVQDTTGQKIFYSFPNTPDTRSPALPQSESSGSEHTTEYEDSDDLDGEDELPPGRRRRTPPTSSRWQSRVRRFKRRMRNNWHTFREFMTAPLWAALASLMVACIQPLQHALDQHLPPVKGAIAAAGNCSIPITLVVLGAYFYSPPEPPARHLPEHQHRERTASRTSLLDSVRDMFSTKAKGSRGSLRVSAAKPSRPGETRTVVVAILSRMIITPLVLLPLMVPATKYDVQRVFDDPVFVVSNVLLIASPPALTLAQITQAASGDAFERLISRTIFWSYCVVTPPSTILFVVIGLVLSKL